MNEKKTPFEFADRMSNVKKSFIREIFKVLGTPGIISFSGGFPNPESFPVAEIDEAVHKILSEDGKNVLQYSSTEGYLPLRKLIAQRYLKRSGLVVQPEEILIVNGSQQAFDLIGKIFLNKGDHVLLERPAYLGAIQSLSIFEPTFHTALLHEDGIDLEAVENILDAFPVKLMYSVPNFQNPTGITYSAHNRKLLARLLEEKGTILIEDDPYGELRFSKEDLPPIKTYLGDQGILLGSFSKIVSPGMRMGWIVATAEIMEKLIVAKQASDLHSNYLAQRIITQYLLDHDVEEHIAKIRSMYNDQCSMMLNAIDRYFPKEVKTTIPEGGMFMWVSLPDGCSSVELFNIAKQENVVFVPGDPFYVDEHDTPTLRLNYTNSSEAEIEEGIKRLGVSIAKLMEKASKNS